MEELEKLGNARRELRSLEENEKLAEEEIEIFAQPNDHQKTILEALLQSVRLSPIDRFPIFFPMLIME